MNLKAPCEHGRYDEHNECEQRGCMSHAKCRGGRLLPADTLVIEKVDTTRTSPGASEREWLEGLREEQGPREWQLPRRAWHVLNAAAAFGVPGGSIKLLDDLADALAASQLASDRTDPKEGT